MTVTTPNAPSRPSRLGLAQAYRRCAAPIDRLILAVDRLLTSRRVTIYSATFVGLGALLLVAATIERIMDPHTGGAFLPDYLAHWTGGRMLLSHDIGHLYNPISQSEYQSAALGGPVRLSWFVSPPFVAALYAPLARLSYNISAACWLVLSTALLICCLGYLKSLAPTLMRRHRRTVILAIIACPATFELLGGGQDSAVMLAVWLAGIALLKRNRPALAGGAFGLGVFKPQHVVLIPLVLLATRRFKAFLGFAAVSGLALLLTIGLLGVGTLRSWISTLASPLYLQQVQEDQAWKMVSLPSFVIGLAPHGWVHWLLPQLNWSIALGAVLFLTWMVTRKASASDPHALWMCVLTTTIVFSPHVALYDAILLVPVAVFLLERRPSARLRVTLFACFWLLWIAPGLHELAGGFGWPLSIIGSPWAALPIVLLWTESMAEMAVSANVNQLEGAR